MAQLLIIHENCAKRKVERGVRKTEAEDHAIQPVGDIIGVFEDDHVFSPTEYDVFEIVQVLGFTKLELITEMPYPDTKIVEKNKEEIDYWKDSDDGKWKKLKKRVKFRLSTNNLTMQDKQDLSSVLIPKAQKQIIVKKFKNRIKDNLENLEDEE